METFEEKITPILQELEISFIEQAVMLEEGLKTDPPIYSDEALRYATQIFVSVLLAKIHEANRGKELKIVANMASEAGARVRSLIMDYTGLDSFDFYKEEK